MKSLAHLENCITKIRSKAEMLIKVDRLWYDVTSSSGRIGS